MAIIKQYHKDTDTTYVYESTSYWDSEKGQSRSKRTLLGKIDPATGEIIPTGKRGRSKKEPVQTAALPADADNSPLKAALDRNTVLEQKLKQQQIRIEELERKNSRLLSTLAELSSGLDKYAALCRSLKD